MTAPFATADILDANGDSQSCTSQFLSLGGLAHFSGRIRTVLCFEDNVLVKQCLSAPGAGAVLVVDGGGSLRCGLAGDQIGAAAVRNGWAGIVINGAIRDSAAWAKLAIGLKALGTSPRKSSKRGIGAIDVPLLFGEILFTPGDILYSDQDGILVAPPQTGTQHVEREQHGQNGG